MNWPETRMGGGLCQTVRFGLSVLGNLRFEYRGMAESEFQFSNRKNVASNC